MERIRFHLHADVSRRIGDALRAHGIDVSTTAESSLTAAGGRALVTRDVDFLRLATASPDHPGLVSWQRSGASEREIVQHLVLLWQTTTPQDMQGRVEYL